MSETKPNYVEAFDENQLERFDNGKLSEDQIYMMLIIAIRACESAINDLYDEVRNQN